MTNSFSTLKLWRTIPYNCYETIHTWNPSCFGAFTDFAYVTAKGALWIYIPLYLAPHLITRDFSLKALESTSRKFGTSMTAITTNTALIIGFCCIITKSTGKVFYLAPFMGSFLAHFFSFWFERPSRRNALAMFSSKSAFEILFKIIKDYGYLEHFPENFAAVLLFAASISINFYLAKKKGFSKDPLSQILAFLVGKQEGLRRRRDVTDGKGAQEPSEEDANSNRLAASHEGREGDAEAEEKKTKTEKKRGECDASQGNGMRSALHKSENPNGWGDAEVCPHRTPCPQYVVQGLLKPFLVGWLGQGALLALRAKTLNPVVSLCDANALRLGAFLGGMGGLFRASQCCLRNATGREQDYHALISGFLASLTLAIYPSTQISLYTFWKTAYTLYWARFGKGIAAQYTVDFVFNICDSILINCAIMEPQYTPRSYLKFMDGVTAKKLRLVNVALYYILTDQTNTWYYGDKVHPLVAEATTSRYLETVGSWLMENKHNFKRVM